MSVTGQITNVRWNLFRKQDKKIKFAMVHVIFWIFMNYYMHVTLSQNSTTCIFMTEFINIPRHTGHEGCSILLTAEACACSIEPVNCTSTVNSTRHISTCKHGQNCKHMLKRETVTIFKCKITENWRITYLKRWKTSSIKMFVKIVCWALIIKPNQNTVVVLHSIISK